MTEGPDLPLGDLADALNQVPGSIIVILGSCGSGAAVRSNNEKNGSSDQVGASLEAFNAQVIRAFSEIDPGIVVNVNGNVVANGEVVSNTGEFRKNKFYVLAASEYQKPSYAYTKETIGDDYKCNYFPKWLTEGIGISGKMAADKNSNGIVTLKELYAYLKNRGDKTPVSHVVWYTGTVFKDIKLKTPVYQHVQVYPKNSNFPLFAR